MTRPDDGKSLEEIQRDAERAQQEAARLEAELAAARQAAERARQEAERRRRAAELAWAERTLMAYPERRAAAAEAVAAAQDAFAKAVLDSPLGKAFAALMRARLARWGVEADYFDALATRGTPSTSRAPVEPVLNYDREMREILNRWAGELWAEADEERRAARERAIRGEEGNPSDLRSLGTPEEQA